MSFFSGLRGMITGDSDLDEKWNIPESEGDLHSILNNDEKLQIIYKHSYSCSISVFAKSRLESRLEDLSKLGDLHFVDVRANREISNKIAKKTGVIHQSPQIILLENGNVVFDTSHGGVGPEPVFQWEKKQQEILNKN